MAQLMRTLPERARAVLDAAPAPPRVPQTAPPSADVYVVVQQLLGSDAAPGWAQVRLGAVPRPRLRATTQLMPPARAAEAAAYEGHAGSSAPLAERRTAPHERSVQDELMGRLGVPTAASVPGGAGQRTAAALDALHAVHERYAHARRQAQQSMAATAGVWDAVPAASGGAALPGSAVPLIAYLQQWGE